MPNAIRPTVGSWYETDAGDVFTVLDVARTADAIDIQYVGGRVETIDRAMWAGMSLREVEPLEEWHASMDDFPAGRRKKSD